MPPGSSRSTKPKPSDVAAETKKHYIPTILKQFASQWKTFSYLYESPLEQLTFDAVPRQFDGAPKFFISSGDPVDAALSWTGQLGEAVPFICAANDKRPGGDWETGVVGYEERLCRRSTLSATLAIPGPNSYIAEHYPIPYQGGILSENVVVFRGPHERYEKWDLAEWKSLPVCSVPPIRWPKLKSTHKGTKYSFDEERDIVKNKIRAAVRICVYNGYSHIVVGDWGLGNGTRNPPQELAEIWREVFLWDTEIRGRVAGVAFVFEDADQNTTQLIQDDMSKRDKKHGGGGGSSSSKGKSKSSSSGGGGSSSSSAGTAASGVTDANVFDAVFQAGEIDRVLHLRAW